MWIWHSVERSYAQRIFIQDEKVRIILLLNELAQQLFIWSTEKKISH